MSSRERESSGGLERNGEGSARESRAHRSSRLFLPPPALDFNLFIHPLFTSIVIASHIGYEEDQKLASQISGAQIIVGGHSHSLLLSNKSAGLSDTVVGPYPTLVKDKTGKEVYVVQALWGGKYLGVLDVQVDTSVS